jgi:hypothetical protein
MIRLHAVGVLLFGSALIRARVFPRTASALFTIGALKSVGPLYPPLLISAVSGVLAAPAMGWMAVVLWRRMQQGPAAA